MMESSAARLKKIVPPLLRWYDQHKKAYPWRATRDPYVVWLSEIMLQQTRIEVVLHRFPTFLAAYPTLAALAAADEEALRKHWQGLGYYRRVEQLQRAAQQLVDEGASQLPADFDALLKLPGIGRYTAGAIASLGFGLPCPAVDGNVLRVLARLTADEREVTNAKTQRAAEALVAAIIPPERPGDFNEALMELGERLCLPNTAPLCSQCPLGEHCLAYRRGIAAALPRRAKAKSRRREYRTVLLFCVDDTVAIRRRPAGGLLANLWEFPHEEGRPAATELAKRFPTANIQPLGETKHIFTHLEWHLAGYRLTFDKRPALSDATWVTAAELRDVYAMPTAFRYYREQL